MTVMPPSKAARNLNRPSIFANLLGFLPLPNFPCPSLTANSLSPTVPRPSKRRFRQGSPFIDLTGYRHNSFTTPTSFIDSILPTNPGYGRYNTSIHAAAYNELGIQVLRRSFFVTPPFIQQLYFPRLE